MSRLPALKGLAAASGVAIGPALYYNPDADTEAAISAVSAGDEPARLERAIIAADAVIAGTKRPCVRPDRTKRPRSSPPTA